MPGAGLGIEGGSDNSIGRAALRQAQQTLASVESALSPNFVQSGMPIKIGAVSVERFPATVATRVATQQSVIFWVACRADSEAMEIPYDVPTLGASTGERARVPRPITISARIHAPKAHDFAPAAVDQ